MKLNHYLTLLLLIALAAAGMIVFQTLAGYQNPDSVSKLGSAYAPSFADFDTYATSTVHTVTSGTPNLSANGARVYLRLCSTGSDAIYWAHTSSSLAVGKGERLDPYGSTTSTQPCVNYPGYKGPVYAISAATTTVLITEAY